MRRYKLTLTVERDASRRLDAGAHRAKVETAIARALPEGWSLTRARITSRAVAPPTPEAPPAPPAPRDPLARIDARLPAEVRAWMGAVLRATHLLRCRVETANRTDRGRCWGERRITLPKSYRAITEWDRVGGGWDYERVTAWLRARGAETRSVSDPRYLFLHEVAHAVAWKRRRSTRQSITKAIRGGSAAGRVRALLDRANRLDSEVSHGTRFRRALLGLLRRWAPEAFGRVEAPAAAGETQPS